MRKVHKVALCNSWLLCLVILGNFRHSLTGESMQADSHTHYHSSVGEYGYLQCTHTHAHTYTLAVDLIMFVTLPLYMCMRTHTRGRSNKTLFHYHCGYIMDRYGSLFDFQATDTSQRAHSFHTTPHCSKGSVCSELPRVPTGIGGTAGRVFAKSALL